MAWDLAISNDGDLLFAANRDFQGVSGDAQVAQRIRTRLKVPRGSWIFDETKTFGSNLREVLRHTSVSAEAEIPIYVHQALENMEGVSINDVQVVPDESGRQMTALISFSVDILVDEIGSDVLSIIENQQFQVNVPL